MTSRGGAAVRRRPLARRPSRGVASARRRSVAGFIAPFAALFGLFYLLPIGYALYRSFFVTEREGPFGAPQEVFLDREVLPGETIDIAIPMTAPTALGEYRSDWVMANSSRSNFKEAVYLEITVARPATSTPTASATATMTLTPTATATP